MRSACAAFALVACSIMPAAAADYAPLSVAGTTLYVSETYGTYQETNGWWGLQPYGYWDEEYCGCWIEPDSPITPELVSTCIPYNPNALSNLCVKPSGSYGPTAPVPIVSWGGSQSVCIVGNICQSVPNDPHLGWSYVYLGEVPWFRGYAEVLGVGVGW